jgi:peptidoglycan L-alanyl-D-glutamate endopeptidase CwlK
VNTDTALLYPPFAHKVLRLMCEYNVEHPDQYLHILEGYRSPERQDQLWAQGRTVSGRKVTNAWKWRSWHQYGLAVDLIGDNDVKKPGRQKPYEVDWHHVGFLAKRLGLEWGGDWESKDMGHVQMTGGMSVTTAHHITKVDGLLEVWCRIGKL